MTVTDSGPAGAAGTEPRSLAWSQCALLFLFALALRLPLLPAHRLAEGDGVHYATLARAVLAGDASGLANPYWSNFWPAVIALFSWLARVDVETGGRLAALAAGCALAPATAALAARTLGGRSGVVAGLLVAGHPWLIHFSSLLFSESLFSLLLVLLLLSAVRCTGTAGAAATGAWAGLSLVTRPEAYAGVAAVLGGLLAPARRPGRGPALRRAAVFLAVVLAFVVARAWLVQRYEGGWDFGGMKATANLFVGLAETDSEKERVATELTAGDENALARQAADQSALGFALAHPGRMLRHLALNGALLLASSLRVFPFVPLVGGRPPPWAGDWPVLLVLWSLGVCAVAGFGLVTALASRGPVTVLAATGLLYAAGLLPFTIHDRLVVALVPLFVVFLAHGLVLGVGRLFKGRGFEGRGLAAGCVALGLASLAGLIRAPALDYAGDPVVQREAGEWLGARYPQDAVLMTAAPCVDFYFHDAAHPGREVSLPWADYPGVLEVARRQDVRLLAVPEWHLRATRHPAAGALLQPEAVEPELELVAALGAAGERMLIYELRSAADAP